jgi:hypothetical protein
LVLMRPVTGAFVANIDHYVAAHGLGLVHFREGERKDDIAKRYLAEATRAGGSIPEGILLVGRAQEKALVPGTQKRRDPVTGTSSAWLARESVLVSHFCFYGFDNDFGPFFLKFCSYFPYAARLCRNGDEYAKRQAATAGIGFTPLDNAFAAVDDVAGAQAICDGLDAAKIEALAGEWLARLPCPFTEEGTAAGYRHEAPVLQAGFSLTQMLDRPLPGRAFFGQMIRGNLGIGRPGQGRPGLRPPDPPWPQEARPRPVPHPHHLPRRHPQRAHRLQDHDREAAPQGRTSAPDRGDHQQPGRFRPREAAA